MHICTGRFTDGFQVEFAEISKRVKIAADIIYIYIHSYDVYNAFHSFRFGAPAVPVVWEEFPPVIILSWSYYYVLSHFC